MLLVIIVFEKDDISSIDNQTKTFQHVFYLRFI